MDKKMVKHISIKNFKSIKSLEFEARRVNVFIGEPNAGKSNILEALGSFSPHVSYDQIVRAKSVSNIFYDNDINEECTVEADDYILEFSTRDMKSLNYTRRKKGKYEWSNSHSIVGDTHYADIANTSQYNPFRFYRYEPLKVFTNNYDKYLKTPDGANLYYILNVFKEFRKDVANLLNSIGYKLNIRIEEQEIEYMKEKDGIFYSYPYQTLSDTFQRIIFYLAAIESNKNAVLLFEEPEANTFPFYTKELAEKIALDADNQYFLVTHNPYLLHTLIEKTPIDDLNIFVTYMKDYETRVQPMSKDDIAEVFDFDEAVFFNLDRYLNESIHS